jgi:tRNA pseudouridine55 synthase
VSDPSHPGTDGPTGMLVVDKPAGMTSHDVVAVVRKRAGTRRVGHAGTLDPAATGVLVLGLGRGTRLLHYLVGSDKQYQATIRLGVATSTDDADGEVLLQADASGVDRPSIRSAMATLTGTIEQVPSQVSAVKVAGRSAHALVRAGEQVQLAPRAVAVHAFDLVDVRHAGEALDLDVAVSCSSGTYVRALARDLGAALRVGGHVRTLRRTRVGPFSLADAHRLDAVPDGLGSTLLPLGQAAARFLPFRTLEGPDAARVGHGIPPTPTGRPGPVALLDPDGHLLAVAEDRGPRAALSAVFVG